MYCAEVMPNMDYIGTVVDCAHYLRGVSVAQRYDVIHMGMGRKKLFCTKSVSNVAIAQIG